MSSSVLCTGSIQSTSSVSFVVQFCTQVVHSQLALYLLMYSTVMYSESIQSTSYVSLMYSTVQEVNFPLVLYLFMYSRVGQILTFFKIQESGIYDWIRVKILRTK